MINPWRLEGNIILDFNLDTAESKVPRVSNGNILPEMMFFMYQNCCSLYTLVSVSETTVSVVSVSVSETVSETTFKYPNCDQMWHLNQTSVCYRPLDGAVRQSKSTAVKIIFIIIFYYF